MQSSKNQHAPLGSAKRRSGQLDFSNIAPLKAGGTVGFSAFRDKATEATRRKKARRKSNGNVAEDSEEDDDDDSDVLNKMDDDNEKEVEPKLGQDDSKFGGELVDGVNRIHVSRNRVRIEMQDHLANSSTQLKRAHSADPDSHSTPETSQRGTAEDSPTPQGQPMLQPPTSSAAPAEVPPEAIVGSPLKKARPSIDQTNAGEKSAATQSLSAALGAALTSTSAPVPPAAAAAAAAAGPSTTAPVPPPKVQEEDEEL